MGIDPAEVDRAARLIPAEGGESGLARALGGPVKHRRDFQVAGGGLTGGRASRVLSAIRGISEQHGEGEANAAGVSWASRGEPSRTFIAVHPEREGTRVRIGVDRSGGLLLTAFLSLTAGAVGASIVGAVVDPGSVAAGVAILGGGITGGLAVGRAVWAATTRRVRERMDRLGEAITQALEDPAATPS